MYRQRLLRCLRLLLPLVPLLFSAADVAARPGGGNTSSGGGSGGGGGGGGGFSPFFFFGGGTTGTIIFIIVMILFTIYKQQSSRAKGGQTTPMDALPPPTREEELRRWQQSDAEIEANLADLQKRDPAFDRARFTDRVATAYTILNAAWVKGDLTPVLPFLGEGEATRLRMQLDGDRARNRRNVMDDMVLNGTRIVRVEQSGAEDLITLRIDASAADYYVDTQSGNVTDGWRSPRPYTEYWTFARAGTVQTPKTGYLDRHCPHCGAPLELGNISVCQYCQTPVASTDYDWVLMTIEQKYAYDATQHPAS